MVSKQAFIDNLDGTAAKVKAAFKAGYETGFEDGGSDIFDLGDEWQWYKEKIDEDDQ